MMRQKFSRTARIHSAWVVALYLVSCPGLASAERIKAQLSTAPNVPPPITRSTPATVVVEMEAKEYVGTLAEGVKYKFWSFNGTVPGPMIRVRVGDTVEIHLTNGKDSTESHNIDFHAVNGPGGGAVMLNTEPGKKTGLSFQAINPGLYVYHCATASPSIPAHIANGMYGMILVEPEGGLPPVDKEFYILQSDFYTKKARGSSGKGTSVLEFDHAKGLAEQPTYVVYNGMAGSLVKNPLTAKAGDRIRIFFGNAGPNLVSSWHIIGEIFDKVWTEGSLTTTPLENVQTTLVPAAGSTIAELTVEVPGTYVTVDHSIFRIEKGALGLLKVKGEKNPAVYWGVGSENTNRWKRRMSDYNNQQNDLQNLGRAMQTKWIGDKETGYEQGDPLYEKREIVDPKHDTNYYRNLYSQVWPGLASGARPRRLQFQSNEPVGLPKSMRGQSNVLDYLEAIENLLVDIRNSVEKLAQSAERRERGLGF